jgi:3'-phosphoadenosine 5'-phosphosulfate (PAPS) 3'-phosphatase
MQKKVTPLLISQSDLRLILRCMERAATQGFVTEGDRKAHQVLFEKLMAHLGKTTN